MGKMNLNTPVSELSGVGKARTEALSRLGIHTALDLIYYFPRAYENRGDIRPLSKFDLDAPASYILTVASEVHSVKINRGLTISKFRAFDDSGSVQMVFFNSPFIKDIFHIGSVFRFYGKAALSKGRLEFVNPKYEPYIEGVALADLVPIYPKTEGLSSKQIDKLIRAAIDDCLPEINDPLPDSLRLSEGLPTLRSALLSAHFPESEEALAKAFTRLAYDEMLTFGIGVSMSGSKRRRGGGIRFSRVSLAPLTEKLPYELTASQKNAINDIYKDTVLGDGSDICPMARIIVGDVGCGKTICAVAAMYISARSGYQSALMVPTEILANQHYEDISALLNSLGIKTELLLGSTAAAQKRRIYASLASGETDIVIGTHALISDKVEFSNLGLVITDEQHRFGVAQRAKLKEKSKSAHLLVMSATPIPRTLALTMYGDLDISRITEMPKGRMRVDTFVVDEGYRQRLNDFIKKQAALGGQCYVVCPSIEKNEDDENSLIASSIGEMVPAASLDLKSAVEHCKELSLALPGLRVDLLHGKMKAKEKDEIMERYSSGETDVLVSTTVIEVGINVPRATLMIVENAERFGLSALHQLRGRVGRGKMRSYCVLVSDNHSEGSRARLEVMRTTYDGFEIAEKDLLLRGPGEFFSRNSDNNLRQSGGFDFKFASMCTDTKLFSRAFSAAKAIVECDPELELPEHQALKKLTDERIHQTSSTVS